MVRRNTSKNVLLEHFPAGQMPISRLNDKSFTGGHRTRQRFIGREVSYKATTG